MSSASFKKPPENWAPNHFEILAGPSAVVDAVARKADVRDNFTPKELGVDAGRAVLDHYYLAKGENDKGGEFRASLSFQNATNQASNVLPIAGLAAAIGVDAAIFGSAAEGMQQASILPFNAFTFGALIFATALGLSEKYENTSKKMFLYAALVTASLGASFLAADNDKFRAKFTDTITSVVTKGSDDEQARVTSLESSIAGYQKKIDEYKTRLETEGNGGQNMLADGSTGNDELAKDLSGEIVRLEGLQSKDQTALDLAKPKLDQAERKDPADFTGRLLATAYTAAWLIAAQLLLSEVIRTASTNFQGFRNNIVARVRQRKFVKDIESPDPIKRSATIRSAIAVMLSHFSEKLSLSVEDRKHPNKHQNFANLYQDGPHALMIEAGAGVVEGMITPRGPSLWERFQSLRRAFEDSAAAPVNDAGFQANQGAQANDNVDQAKGNAGSDDDLRASTGKSGPNPA